MASRSRRDFLRALGAAAIALPFYDVLNAPLARAGGVAKRTIFFYFPNGVMAGEGGGGGQFHASGSEFNFSLSYQMEPLAPYKNDCVFLNGLGMGPTDEGSHPGGAKKLLTASDGGYGQSIDQHLASTVGSSAPFHLLYLGAGAAKYGTGDKCISYPSGDGASVAPIDDPKIAFQSLFGSGTGMGSSSGSPAPVDTTKASVIDAAIGDMDALQKRLGAVEASKLSLHMEALREVEKRIKDLPPPSTPSCDNPSAPTVDSAKIYEDASFPDVLRAQMDLMVTAMACGKTNVGTIQSAFHTSDLNMSAFAGAETYGSNLLSHQASHYAGNPAWTTGFIAQVRWWMSQFGYLIGALAARPEPGGSGTMLDNSLVLACSEVSDGSVHTHHNMPFILAGRGGGSVKSGRLLQYNDERHGKLFASIAQAMGHNIQGFGNGQGTLTGLVG